MTAAQLQQYVLEVHAPLAEAESLNNHARPDWWNGTCDSTCAVLEEELADELAPFKVVEWGSFDCGELHDGHCWLEAIDGTIVDPTSQQYGFEPCAIIALDDPRQMLYQRPGARAERNINGA